MSSVKKGNDTNLSSIIDSSLKTVVKFSAEWCGPCKMIAPIFEEVANEMPNVSFVSVDIDDPAAEKIVASHNIQMVPTLVFYKNKEIVNQFSGFKPKEELLKILNSF